MLEVLTKADALAANAILVKMSKDGAIAPARLRADSMAEAGYNGTEIDLMFAFSAIEVDESGKCSWWGRRADPSNRGSQSLLDVWNRPSPGSISSPCWIADLYRASRGVVTDEQIIAMFDALETAIYFDMRGLDSALAVVDVKRLAPEFIVGPPSGLNLTLGARA